MALTDLDLPPELVDLAVAAGVLTPAGSLSDTFFADPGAKLAGALTDPAQRAALLRLAQRLLDETGGAPPVEDDGQRWVPLVTGPTGPPASGLYAVVTEEPGGSVLIGAGGVLRHSGPPEVKVTGHLPLVRVGAGPADFLVGGSDGALTVELDLALADAGDGPLDLDGIAARVVVPTNGSEPTLVLRLRLGPDGDAGDIVLDSGQPLGDQAVGVVLDLLTRVAGDAADELGRLLAIIGLGGSPSIPVLPLADLVAQGRAALWTWVRSLATTPGGLAAWLTEAATLLGLDPPAGTGTTADPWRACHTSGDVHVCLGLAVDRSGAAPVVVPTVSVRTEQTIGGRPVVATVDATPVRVVLGAQPEVLTTPVVEGTATIGQLTGTTHLLNTTVDGHDVRVGAARFGVRVSVPEGVAAVVEAHRVRIDTTDYPVLDLTDADAVLAAAQGAVQGALNGILAALGDTGPARALLALAGLAVPNGLAAGAWPHTSNAIDVLADPLGALRAFHAAALGAGQGDVVLAEIARLLGVSAPTVDGTGGADDPWVAELAGPVRVMAWTTDDGGRRLHLGLGIGVVLAGLVRGRTPGLAARLEVLSVAVDGPADATALPSFDVLVTTGPLELEVGAAVVAVDDLRGGARWAAGAGLVPVLEVDDPHLVLDDESRLPVPVPAWDPVAGRFGWPGGAIPWDAVEPLLGAVLDSLGPPALGDLAVLLGWRRPDGVDAPLIGTAPSGRLSIGALMSDPLAAVATWLTGVLATSEAAGWAAEIAGWLDEALAGAGVTGTGQPDDPWRIAVTADGSVALTAHTEGIPALGSLADLVLPAPVAALAADGPTALDPGQPGIQELAAALLHGAATLRDLAALVDGRDPHAVLAALRSTLSGGDGVVPVAAQHRAGAATATIDGATFLTAPAAFIADVHAADVPAAASRLFAVCSTPGLAPWADQADARVIDLTSPGAGAPAAALARIDGPGPWFVVLPAAATATADDLADRLADAVARLRPHAGAGVGLIAHGAAGHAALDVAARTGSGVTAVVTVATAHGVAAVAWPADATDGGQLVLALAGHGADELPAADGWPAAVPGGDLLELLSQHPTMVTDGLAPPATVPALPPGVALTTVAADVPPEAVDGLIAIVLRAATAAQVASAPATGAPGLRVGVAARVAATSPGAGGVRVRADMRADLLSLGTTTDGERRLHAVLRIDRPGGWLAGGPADPAAPVACRAAEIHVGRSLGGGTVVARVIVHEGRALGLTRPRWEIDPRLRTPGRLLPEERDLLGAITTGLGAVGATGELRALADLVVAVGLGALDGASRLTLGIDAVEQALVAPTSAAIADVAAAVGALRRLVGAAATPTGTDVVVTRGDATVTITLGTSPRLRFDVAAVTGLGAALTATVTAAGAAATADLRLGPLVASIDTSRTTPATVAVEVTGAPPLPLLPDPPPLERVVDVVTAAVPAGLIRTGLEWARDAHPAFASLVDLLGLGAPDQRVRLPVALVRDPAGWLLDAAALGTSDGRPDPAKVARLVEFLAGFVPGSHPPGGLVLPGGMVLAVSPAGGGGLSATLGWPAPITAGPVRVDGHVGVSVGATGDLRPDVSLLIDLLDPADPTDVLGGIELAATPAAAVTARIPLGGSVVEIPIVPAPSLTALAGTAQRALPLALDALTELTVGGQPVGHGLALLGDALAVRTGTAGNRRFSGDELATLAASPAQIPVRLAANAADAAAGLAGLLDPVIPGTLGSTGGVATYTNGPLRLTFDGTGTRPTFCAAVTNLAPVTGLALSAEVCVSDRLERISASGRVTDPALLALPGVSLFPELTVEAGPGTAHAGGRVQLTAWTADVAAPGAARGVSLVVDLATGASVHVRTEGSPTPGTGVAAALVTDIAVPLAGALVLSLDEVVALLERNAPGTTTPLGQLLHDALVTRTGSGTTARYGLAPRLLDPAELPGRVIRAIANVLQATLASASIGTDPVQLRLVSVDDGTRRHLGIGITIADGDDLPLLDTGSLRLALEVADEWVAEARTAMGAGGAAPSGIELLLVSVPTSSSSSAAPEIAPQLRIGGLGLRVSSPDDDRLIDLGVTLRSLGFHSLLELGPTGISGGGHVELDGFGLPVGAGAGGGNPVAASLLGPDTTGGDGEPLAATFSPSLTLVTPPSGTPVVLFRAGPGDGPWWIPVQRAFGPLYVDQIGVGRTVDARGDVQTVSLILDGGASLAGLTVAVDDLSVILPIDTIDRPATWTLDLAGLAIGYEGSGVRIAGGLRKRPVAGATDYVGMLQVTFAQYGITAVGAYGVFPVPPPSTGTYASMFLFAALRAPLGGPPAFFVTGIGAGAGLNRRLIAPTTIEEVPTFPLVDALSPNSTLASQPMQAIDRLGATFPPERGALWFAAGVTFTSFALVETLALLTVEIHDGLEINLLGLSRMALPTPATPVAQIELAVQARFSSREAVLSVIAQLTDNSWVVNEACRLTGGFAFVVWFRTGEFVLTLGGYHPRFDKPSHYPDVPRLGLRWEPASGIVVKGGAYFALTSGAVMTGGEIEVSYNVGPAWARLTAGVNVLVEWDPLHYDVEVWIQVSAGVQFEVCFFVCKTVRLSFSLGVHLHIEGPKLRGTATLDLYVISVTVRFGPSGAGPREYLSWAAFRDKYILAPGSEGFATSAIVGSGLRTSEKTPAASGNDPGPDGTSQRPWLVEPEFSLTITTRVATTEITGVTAADFGAFPLGPRGVTLERSALVVRLVGAAGDEVTGRTLRTPQTGRLPGAVWAMERDGEPPSSPSMVDSYTGLGVEVKVTEPTNGIAVEIEQVDKTGPVHPLPYATVKQAAGRRAELGKLRVSAQRLQVDARRVGGPLGLTARAMVGAKVTGRLPKEQAAAVAEAAAGLAATRMAPPQVRSLAEGIAEPNVRVPATKALPARDSAPVPTAPLLAAPRLRTLVELATPPAATPTGPRGRGLADVPRVPAPTVSDVRRSIGATLGAELRWTPPAVNRGSTGRAREHHRRLGIGATIDAATVERELTQRRGLETGAGRGQVWDLPGRGARDVEQGRLTVAGDGSVRVVALDPGGNPLVDQTVAGGDAVAVPSIASRLVTVAAPAATDALAGWLASTAALQVGSGALVVPGATVRVPLRVPTRRAGTVAAAVRRVGAAIADGLPVETRLPARTTTVVVGIADTGDASAGEAREPAGLVISGAAQVADEQGRPVPPVVVDEGAERWLVIAIAPGDDPVTVAVVPDAGQRIVGVVGSALPAARVGADLADHGVAAVTPPPLATAGGAVRLRWIPEKPERPTDR